MSARRTIWKFELEPERVPWVKMPRGAQILTVAMQRDVACVWALVDPDAPLVERRLEVVGTGHEFTDEHGDYVGTLHVSANGVYLVFHVFDRGEFPSAGRSDGITIGWSA